MPSAVVAPSRQPAIVALPPVDDWRTSDQDEINRRRLRAREEAPRIVNTDERFPIFSNFEVHSPSGLTYSTEIRDLGRRQFSCDCVDSRVNGLGTCKHVEAVLDYLERERPADYAAARASGSERIDLVPDRSAQNLKVEHGIERLPKTLRRLFDRDGRLSAGYLPEMALELWKGSPQPELRISQEVGEWLECRKREAESFALRRAYEHNVQSGLWPAQETSLPLFPYQREGMLHLACAERALLADEMGLGKTLQAVAACALLRRLGRIERVLVVTPASLQSEWAEQIGRSTRLPFQVLEGSRAERLAAYERARAPFFTVTTYDAMLTDALEVNERLRPEVVILDEAQRIRNWNTKTALAVKRLRSRYAWVLTGTPLENRIDELYSLVSYLDPAVFGPLFRFNREFYEFDEKGRPRGYRKLDELRRRIRPLLLRRQKTDVETELPNRVERTFLVPMSESQRTAYRAHEAVVTRLLDGNRRRPLNDAQRERLIRETGMMRMLCDSPYILDAADRTCPKVDELSRLLAECMANPDVKVLVFSEWERMLELAADLCKRLKIDFAMHTGGITAARRRQEVQRFRDDPGCRVMLSTDNSGSGLNLQHASVVIHCDQPWNPARLEQRVARAWRKDQTRAVTVLNLVSERTIEQRMLSSIANAQAFSDGVLGEGSEVKTVRLIGARESFVQRLEQLVPLSKGETRQKLQGKSMGRVLVPPSAGNGDRNVDRKRDGKGNGTPQADHAPTDLPREFCRAAADLLDGALVSCEERFPARGESSVLLVVVESGADQWREKLRSLESRYFGPAADGQEPPPAVRLEVMERSTSDLLRRLAEAGVVTPSQRASRTLFPASDVATVPLSAAEQHRARASREQHARKVKMARVLAAEEMIEEARGAALGAIHEMGRALAVENRLPEPRNALGAIAPPLDACWAGGESALSILRSFLVDENAPVQPVLSALGRPVERAASDAHDFFAGIKAKLATIGN